MKAFMTACAVLASSANADPQMISNVVNLDQPIGQRAFIRPYNVLPFNHISYTNSFGYTNTLPLTTYGRPSVPTYRVATLPANHFFKREAELESPYDIKTKVDNPVDGSKHEVQIQVDRSGKGQSFQRVEQNDQHKMRNDYIMDHRSMAQRPLMSKMYLAAHRGMDMNRQMERNQMGMNQMRMDRHQMDVDRWQLQHGQPRQVVQGMNQRGMYNMNEIEMYDLQEVAELAKQAEVLMEEIRQLAAQNNNNGLLNGNGQANGQGNGQGNGLEESLAIQAIKQNFGNLATIADTDPYWQSGKTTLDSLSDNLTDTLRKHNDLGVILKNAIQLYKIKLEQRRKN